ncbi:hypothetical protein [Neobacillus jeddahensis]|uniref:hypothetical protein n=1 Tax=Neobacillus jeddahensis TaxID=1461580 RepID=UPI000693FCF4|nr:hypothetical protein [Neobacillus jeddahensis]
MKLKMLFLTFALLVMVPNFAAANMNIPVDHEEKPCDCHEGGRHHMMHKDWQAMMAEREKQLLAWVNQYTPDKKEEWTKVLEEKKNLRGQWMSPENAAKREQWKKEKMATMQELKKQLDEGKITKEEFINKLHGEKKMGHWKTYRELKLAVEKKDNKQVATLLNQLLEQTKQHNQQMKEKLKK